MCGGALRLQGCHLARLVLTLLPHIFPLLTRRYYFWGNAKRFADLLMLLETSVCGPGAQAASLGVGNLTAGAAATA